jgi:hypothetical protein
MLKTDIFVIHNCSVPLAKLDHEIHQRYARSSIDEFWNKRKILEKGGTTLFFN